MPRYPRNLVLIGARGAGKSAAGRALADRLGRHFLDTDALLEDWEGLTVAEVFAAYGEGYFRDVEARVVAEVASRGGRVVAAGGGVVLRPGNVAKLQSSGTLVWLRASAATLRSRLAADPGSPLRRPSLTGADPLAEVERVLAEREPLYRAAAALVVETDGKSPDAVAAEISAWVAARPAGELEYEPGGRP
ncbi:MAG: shikimate kinase [Planctomycetales bacterium]|nr:shikimate kinase [Planctomycetales bacterium]